MSELWDFCVYRLGGFGGISVLSVKVEKAQAVSALTGCLLGARYCHRRPQSVVGCLCCHGGSLIIGSVGLPRLLHPPCMLHVTEATKAVVYARICRKLS